MTAFAETEALVAVMKGDDEEALAILDGMLPSERAALVGYLDHLSALADDEIRCPRCDEPATGASAVSVGYLGTRPRHWHAACLNAHDAHRRDVRTS